MFFGSIYALTTIIYDKYNIILGAYIVDSSRYIYKNKEY
jgi:hypothetical protein